MVPRLRERYLEERNRSIAALLTAPRKDETDRFWTAMAEMETTAKVLRRCLDGHSRSTLWGFMESMVVDGMLRKEDLSRFSDELQTELLSVFDRK